MEASHALTPQQSTLEYLAPKRHTLKIHDDLVFCKNNLQYGCHINHHMIDNNNQKNNQN